MEFRTKIKIEPSPVKITYEDSTMFIGSCFASSVGKCLEEGKMPVMINPTGTVYNPVSVYNTLELILTGKEFKESDLYFHNGMWISLYHYTDFSSADPARALEKINMNLRSASDFLKKSKFLFITFGTARVFRLKKTGQIVSNCHKIPGSEFTRELLSAADIAGIWKGGLERLNSFCPELKVVFTISPVRHLKDGAHGNQVSKSVLFLAVEELLGHQSSPGYFPAYEILMDDLRDYRFYSDDMIHPSDIAVDYIWEAFSECYLADDTMRIYKEVSEIAKAFRHRLLTDNIPARRSFARKMVDRIAEIEARIPGTDFSVEKEYFLRLLND